MARDEKRLLSAMPRTCTSTYTHQGALRGDSLDQNLAELIERDATSAFGVEEQLEELLGGLGVGVNAQRAQRAPELGRRDRAVSTKVPSAESLDDAALVGDE